MLWDGDHNHCVSWLARNRQDRRRQERVVGRQGSLMPREGLPVFLVGKSSIRRIKLLKINSSR